MHFFFPHGFGYYLKGNKIKLNKYSFFVKTPSINNIPVTKFILQRKQLMPIYKDLKFKFKKFIEIYFFTKVLGFIYGFKKRIIIKGMGFKFLIFKKILIVQVGLSHNLYLKIPYNLKVFWKKYQEIELFSKSIRKLNVFTNVLLNFKKVNVYTQKGIFLFRKVVKKKLTKKA